MVLEHARDLGRAIRREWKRDRVSSRSKRATRKIVTSGRVSTTETPSSSTALGGIPNQPRPPPSRRKNFSNRQQVKLSYQTLIILWAGQGPGYLERQPAIAELVADFVPAAKLNRVGCPDPRCRARRQRFSSRADGPLDGHVGTAASANRNNGGPASLHGWPRGCVAWRYRGWSKTVNVTTEV